MKKLQKEKTQKIFICIILYRIMLNQEKHT